MEYNPEQLNYFRICFIAFNLVPEGLRKLLKQEWDFLYKTTLGEWQDTTKNGFDFLNKESRKSHSKNSRYLRIIRKGNTAEWDCSCLFFAILFSDSIGTTLSAAIKKEVDDLRQVRNDIAHISEAKLGDAEFRSYVGRVLLAFNSLKLPIKNIEAIKNQTNFPTAEVSNIKAQAANLQSELKEVKFDLQVAKDTIQEKEEQVESLTQEINSKVESFCTLTSKPSHQIIKRPNEVRRIMTKMQELHDGSNRAVSTIYLSGNPGCGKTQIARQIGEEFFKIGLRENEDLTFVVTLNAETLETIADSYLILAKRLGITEYSLTNLATTKDNSPEKRIQHLQCLVFAKLKQFSKWLMIADNVVDLSSVCRYLPQTGSEEFGHGQVLITTQHSTAIPTNAPHTYHESLSAGMQPEDAAKLLEQVAQISTDEQVQNVIEVLEYQPLALASAAFYVQFVRHGSPTYGWTNYLETLAEGGPEVTEEPLADRNLAYSKTMTAAIKLTLESILQSDDVLRQTFLFLSLCDAEPLPIQAAVDFVNTRTSGQTEELIKAKIFNSSLIMHLYSDDEATGYLKVHNVVHQVLRKIPLMDVPEKYECLSVAVQVFHSLIASEMGRLHENGDACIMLRRITAHCEALLKIFTNTFPVGIAWVKELPPFISPDQVVSWLCSTASVCRELSSSSNAILFSTLASDFVPYLSGTREGNIIKASAFTNHGLVLSLTSQYETSLVYLQKATEVYRAIYSNESAAVATSYDNLGNVYKALGQYNEAKEYHEKALIIKKKIFGEEHADVSATYNNLGNVYEALGQYNEAKEYHEKSLIIDKKVFGEEHATVSATNNNLGNVYEALGQYNEAKEYHEKSLIIDKKSFGEEHATDTEQVSVEELGQVTANLECDGDNHVRQWNQTRTCFCILV